MTSATGARQRTRWETTLSAVSIAIAHAPENAGYGLVAFAPLGLAFGPTAMGLALLGSVIANLVVSTAGAGRLVNSQRASLSLLLSGLIASIVAVVGDASPARILAVVAVAVVGAGVLQVVFGWLRLGRIVKYTPLPVRVGIVSGAGLLLLLTALPALTGHAFGTPLRSAFESPHPGAVGVGLCALGVFAAAARFGSRVPPILLGLCAATALRFALDHGLAGVAAGAVLGPLVGTPSLSREWLFVFHPTLLSGDLLQPALLTVVVTYAVTAAVLCSLDTLLTVSVVDGRLRLTRDANRELRGQGFANIATGLLTGQAFSPAMPRSLAVAVPNAQDRHVIVLYALGLLGVLVLVPQWIGFVPVSAIGGVLLLQGFQMVAPAFWRAPLDLWRQRAAPKPARAGVPLRGSGWAIELVVALSAVVLGLGQAVLIGATFAVLLFVRANMRDVVRSRWSGQTRRSLKARAPAFVDALARAGSQIAVLELEGPLFFGTADGLRARLQQLEATVETTILDLRQVNEVDVTAARILVETAEDWERAGRRLVFAEWAPTDARRHLLEAAGAASPTPLRFFDHTDLALEQAEDALLQRLQLDPAPALPLTLAETMLGHALDADELVLLTSRLTTVQVGSGKLLFSLGDPGDALYVSLQGDIGLRTPGSDRRLASFAPGVVIGEMAMLSGGTRSAEAVAESDVVLLTMSREAFERLMVEHPALAAKLLRNIALHLATRVRTLTGDLSRWVARSSAGRGDGS